LVQFAKMAAKDRDVRDHRLSPTLRKLAHDLRKRLNLGLLPPAARKQIRLVAGDIT
jgi:uncharacterized protein (DUF2236 family)